MADFSRPEYASYVQLCRKLRLERRLQPGDFYWEFGVVLQKDRFQVFAPVRAGRPVMLPRGNETTGTVWLPALADWFEVLEAVEVVGTARDYYIRIALAAFDDIYIVSAIWPSESLDGEGPTREEAAARLWMAVKKG